MPLNALATTQPTNQKPTGNLYMAPGGQTYANQGVYMSHFGMPGSGSSNPAYNDSMGNPKVSTTTISNTNKIDAVPGIINNTNILADKGVRTDPLNGVSTLANGQVAPEPEKRDANGLLINPPGALYDRNTGLALTSPEKTGNNNVELPYKTADTSYEDSQINDNLNKILTETDANTANMIANIQQKFAQRKAEQADINTRQAKGIQNALLTGGVTGQGSSSQYAPISSEGIVGAQESYGIRQLAALDSQENDLIAEAKSAQASEHFKLLEAKNKEIADVRKQKQDLATKLNEGIAEQNKELRKQNLQIQKEQAIGDIYGKGITDIPEVMAQLKKAGVPATTKEVSDTIGLLSGIGGSGIVGEYNFYKAEAQRKGQVPVDFNTYQNMDANRKKSIAKAGVPQFTTDENGNVIATGNFDALTIGRYNRAFNSATAILQKNPTFKNIVGSSAFLDRIEAAVKNPGSVGDQELLDAFTQLNTGGNRVTEAQVNLITGSGSLSDKLNKIGNQLKKGGALSNDQRQEIVDLSHEVYKNYQKSYRTLYDDAVKRLADQKIPKAFWNLPSPETLSRAVNDVSGTGTDIMQSESDAQTKVDSLSKTDKSVAKIVYDQLSKPDPTLGRVMTYSEVYQYLQAIGKIN